MVGINALASGPCCPLDKKHKLKDSSKSPNFVTHKKAYNTVTCECRPKISEHHYQIQLNGPTSMVI